MSIPSALLAKVQNFIGQSHHHKVLWQAVRESSTVRRRHDSKMDVYRLKLKIAKDHSCHFETDEFNAMFERLETMGLGKFRKVRTPDHSTFTWKYDPRDLSSALVAPDMRDTKSDTITVKGTSGMPAKASSGREVVFFIGGRPLPLTLPSNLSRADLEALADQIRALG